jgi:hypothetical protein
VVSEASLRSVGDGGAETRVEVPSQDTGLEMPARARVRALRRHLVAAMRDLRVANRPERLIQPRSPAPEGFAGTLVQAGCALCRGHCCRGGGTHAYIDERTMALVRSEHPNLDAAAIIRLYTDAIARPGYHGSCLFHGQSGCTLPRPLRSELCNSYYCKGLEAALLAARNGAVSVVIATRTGVERRVTRDDRP